MFVASIDVGTRNLALAVYSSDTHSVVHMEIINLSHTSRGIVRMHDQSLVHLVRKMVMDRKALFERCTIVAIEKQMRRQMIAIQFVLEAILTPMVQYVVQIPPQNVKRWIGTGCRKSHAKNKKAAIKKLKELLDPAGLEQLKRFKKQDDVADASLQAMYAHSNMKKVLKKWRAARETVDKL